MGVRTKSAPTNGRVAGEAQNGFLTPPPAPNVPPTVAADSPAGGLFVVPGLSLGRAHIPIVGTTPLIVHNFSKKIMDQMAEAQRNKGPGRRAKTEHTPRDPEADYEAAMYRFPDGRQGMVATAFKAAMVGACRHVNGLTMTLAKTLFFIHADGRSEDDKPLVALQGDPRMLTAPVRVGNGKADLRYRPIFREWGATLDVEWNASLLSLEAVINLVQIAGWSSGVGDWRPSAPQAFAGEYGRFRIKA